MVTGTSERVPRTASGGGMVVRSATGAGAAGRWTAAHLLSQASVRSVLRELCEARLLADDAACDRWDFAVELDRAQSLQVTHNVLRWLVHKGYVEHRYEVTSASAAQRRFRPACPLRFNGQSCFVLTEAGRQIVASAAPPRRAAGGGWRAPELVPRGASSRARAAAHQGMPRWDAEIRELTVGARLVKRFRWRAPNQERILMAFEEEAWALKIDDPLPPAAGISAKRRLHDTIKFLNRNQADKLIQFRGDGTGEGVVWEFCQVGEPA